MIMKLLRDVPIDMLIFAATAASASRLVLSMGV
jgi:hypothetical protein